MLRTLARAAPEALFERLSREGGFGHHLRAGADRAFPGKPGGIRTVLCVVHSDYRTSWEQLSG